MKKNYINPAVLVARIALESMILAGSTTDPGVSGEPIGGDPGQGI